MYKISPQKPISFFNQPIIVCFQKSPPPIFPLGGDTPFYAFGYEIEDFYLTRKKKRSPLRAAYKICIAILIIHVCLAILLAAECNHAATNSVILYINRTHSYIRIHMATLFLYIYLYFHRFLRGYFDEMRRKLNF